MAILYQPLKPITLIIMDQLNAVRCVNIVGRSAIATIQQKAEHPDKRSLGRKK